MIRVGIIGSNCERNVLIPAFRAEPIILQSVYNAAMIGSRWSMMQ